MNEALFRDDLRNAVRGTIRRLKRTGTVAMGVDNLWQCAVSAIPRNNGPTGANAQWVARRVFDEVVSEPAFRSFVYSQPLTHIAD